ncbi:hypothetical protein D3C72_644210 [compost metagenome]
MTQPMTPREKVASSFQWPVGLQEDRCLQNDPCELPSDVRHDRHRPARITAADMLEVRCRLTSIGKVEVSENANEVLWPPAGYIPANQPFAVEAA